MLTVYRMYYNRNCPFRIGNNMIVTDPNEWEKRVRNYVIEYEENFLSLYEKDIQDGVFGMKNMTFEQWVSYYLEHMVFTDRYTVDNYEVSIPY